jgi:hypothetical protein
VMGIICDGQSAILEETKDRRFIWVLSVMQVIMNLFLSITF